MRVVWHGNRFQNDVTYGDGVAIAELEGGKHPFVVQESTIGAAKIAQDHAPALALHAGVFARDTPTGDDDGVLHAAADGGRFVAETRFAVADTT